MRKLLLCRQAATVVMRSSSGMYITTIMMLDQHAVGFELSNCISVEVVLHDLRGRPCLMYACNISLYSMNYITCLMLATVDIT